MWHLTACKISVSLTFLNWIKKKKKKKKKKSEKKKKKKKKKKKWKKKKKKKTIKKVRNGIFNLSELMMATLIQTCDKNHFIFYPIQERH